MFVRVAPRCPAARCPVAGPRRVLRAASTAVVRPQHDLGGKSSLLETSIPADVPLQAWEVEAHALYACLAKNGLFSTDETRRTIEAFAAEAYSDWGYYEKFSAASALLLREKGHLGAGELEAEIYGEMQSGEGRAFVVGEAVRVREEDSHRTSWRLAPHHHAGWPEPPADPASTLVGGRTSARQATCSEPPAWSSAAWASSQTRRSSRTASATRPRCRSTE